MHGHPDRLRHEGVLPAPLPRSGGRREGRTPGDGEHAGRGDAHIRGMTLQAQHAYNNSTCTESLISKLFYEQLDNQEDFPIHETCLPLYYKNPLLRTAPLTAGAHY